MWSAEELQCSSMPPPIPHRDDNADLPQAITSFGTLLCGSGRRQRKTAAEFRLCRSLAINLAYDFLSQRRRAVVFRIEEGGVSNFDRFGGVFEKV